MSENSDRNSASYKDMLNRMKSVKLSVSAVTDAPGNEADAKDYSKGIRVLTKEGFERYNIDDTNIIYIAKDPDSVFINEGMTIVKKAEPGVFIGGSSVQSTPKKTIVSTNSVPVAEMFRNILRGKEQPPVNTYVGCCNDSTLKEVSTETIG